MPNRSLESAGRVALAAVALIATAVAAFLLFSQWRSSPEAGAAAEPAAAETPASLPVEETPAETPPTGPLPDAVMRRGESGSALQQVRDSQDVQEAALARLQKSVDDLALQSRSSDQALRRELEEARAELARERAASRKVLGFLLAALASLVVLVLVVSRQYPSSSRSETLPRNDR